MSNGNQLNFTKAMDYERYKDCIKELPTGKKLPDAIYVHESVLVVSPKELQAFLQKTIRELGLVDTTEWNIIKFSTKKFSLSLLYYPEFFEDSYPTLHCSYTIDLEQNTFRKTNYTKSNNPPILHRKETFLLPSHSSVPEFQEITKEGENIGLYDNSKGIGFKKTWERLIQQKGYQLVNGRFKPLSIKLPKPLESTIKDKKIQRHKTAIDRNSLSSPVQSLFRHNYLKGGYSFFDYGCGKGDDINILAKNNIPAKGWDPVYYPDNKTEEADIINLGFVINVIENPIERKETLLKAYRLSRRILVASVMLGGEAITSKFDKYGDGVITSRKTFQKYYSQTEFREYLEESLGESPIAVGPGIFYIFKDKLEEQHFLVERQRSGRNWQKLSYTDHPERLKIKQRALYERHKELFEEFWEQCLNLGRLPANNEFKQTEELRALCSSHQKGVDLLITVHGAEPFQDAGKARRNDLLVHYALSLFGQRKSYKKIPESLRWDVKHFFGRYTNVLSEARDLLFSVGKPEVINHYCEQAYQELECGYFEEGHSLTIHRLFVEHLPPALRVYIGCASQLYGDLETVDLVKIHIRSGKVSLMRYDDFEGKPLPLLQERIKIKLREQVIDFFHYGEKYEPQPVYLKSHYISDEFPNYKKQELFDSRLQSFTDLDLKGYGPSTKELNDYLAKKRMRVWGFNLRPVEE